VRVSGPTRRNAGSGSGGRGEQRDVREAILAATERLLTRQRFAEVAVADILAEAGVARGSFYFYFESRYAVLAELARRAVGGGHDAAQPWLDRNDTGDPRATLRQGVLEGAKVWHEHAAVLRAVVENWRDDPELGALWVELIETYTTAAVDRIEADRRAGLAPPPRVDTRQLASSLSWLAERLYYLAAIGVPPFDDRDKLVDVLAEIWTATVYGRPEAPPLPPSNE
jgi:AcrR family transcriptional regulator